MLARLKFDLDSLVGLMLKHIPHELIVNGTVLDPCIGGGQFVKIIEKIKRDAGKTDTEIKNSVFGIEGNKLRRDYAVNRFDLKGTYTVENFLLKEFNGMKFDVIIGNPPYQDSAGQNTLYPKFYSKSVELCKPNGYIAMITPPAIIPGLWGLKDPDGIKMPDPRAIRYIAVGNKVKSYFDKKVASDFCYFILQNTVDNNCNVTVETDNGTILVSSPIFPTKVSESDIQTAQNILNKCFSFYNDPYKATSSDYGNKAKSDPNGTDEAVESISTAGVVKTRKIIWNKPHPHYGSPKVIMPMYGKTAVVDYSHKLVSAAQEKTATGKLPGHNISTVLTNSDQESENLIKVLESNLQRFFNMITGETRAPYINFLKNFKGVSLTNTWDNAQLYKHFNLTEFEITFLETFLAETSK